MPISQCLYTIDGISESFTLDKITEHYYKTNTVLKNTNIFSSDEIVDSTVSLLKKQLDLRDDIINDVVTDKSNNKIQVSGVKAVSDFIVANNLGIFNQIGLKHQERLSPEYIEENRKVNYVKLGLESQGIASKPEDKLSDLIIKHGDKAKILLDEIEADIEVEQKTRKLGTAIHRTLSKIIYDEGSVSRETRSYLKNSLEEMSEYLDGDIDLWTDKIMSLVQQIYSKVGSRGRVLSEVWLRSEAQSLANVKGAIDIIVVDDEGNAHTYDLKISKGSYEHWDSAKQLTADWQLAFYRALLGQYIPINNTELNIIPLVVGKTNADGKLDINNVKLDAIRNRLSDESGKALRIVQKDLTEDYVPGKLTSGKMYLITRKLIPEEKKLSYDPSRSEALLQDLEDLFKDYSINVGKAKLKFEQVLEQAIKNNGFYINYPDFVYEGVEIKNGFLKIDIKVGDRFKTKQELIDEYTPIIKKYIEFGEKNESEIVSSIRNKISTAIQENSKARIEMNNSNQTLFIRNSIDPYVGNGEYKLVKNSEELDSLGLILLQNIKTGNYVLISLTANNLHASYDNEYQFGDIEYIKGFLFFEHFYDELQLDINKIENIEVWNVHNSRTKGTVYDKLPKFNKAMSNKGKQNKLKENSLLTFTERAKIAVKHQKERAFKDLNEAERKNLEDILLKYDKEIDDLTTFELKEIIRGFIRKYPDLADKSFISGFDFNSPVEKLFAFVQMLLLAKTDIIPIGDFERINNYNLHFSNFKMLLSGLFSKNVDEYDKNERKMGSIIEGLKTITPDKVKSRDLQAINRIINGTNSRIGKRFDYESVILNNATRKFYEQTKYGGVQENVIGNHRKQFRNLWLTGPDGKISSEWRVKNPYKFDAENALSDAEREYLKTILFRMYVNTTNLTEKEIDAIDISTVDSLWKTAPEDLKAKIEKGTYFEMPIIRSQQWNRYGNVWKEGFKGVKELAKSIGHEIYDYIDSRELTPEELKDLKKDIGYYEMYDVYSRQSRSFIQEQIAEKGEEYWELDLDAIAHRVIFSKIRKKYLDNILPVINAYAWWIKQHAGKQNEEVTQELEYIANRLKVASLDEHIITQDAEDVVKMAAAAKSITTKAMLAFRPVLLVKELAIGLFKNYTLALTQMLGEEQFNISDLTKAIDKMVSIDKKFSAEWNLIDSINKEYRFANLDINTISKRYRTNRKVGLYTGFGKWMFAMNTIPDYYNRLSLFLAKMIHDGSYDAHYMDEKGFLRYDVTKDKRFSHYFANRDKHKNSKGEYIPAKDDFEYNKQRNLYLLLVNQLNVEAKLQNEAELTENDLVKSAYSNKERDSYKSFTDTVYGYYDKDSQAEWHHTWYGVMYLQFMQFWPGKMSLWFGSKYDKESSPMGKFVHKKQDDGQLLYKKPKYDDPLDPERITEWEFVTEDTGDPLLEWEGIAHEGLFFAILNTLQDIVKGDWTNLKNEELRTRRAMYGLMEGFMMFILFKIIMSMLEAWILENGDEGITGETMQFAAAVNEKILNESNLFDNTFGALRSKPAFWTYTERLSGDLYDIMTGSGNRSIAQYGARNFRALEMLDDF